jgi:hypothetical protein
LDILLIQARLQLPWRFYPAMMPVTSGKSLFECR